MVSEVLWIGYKGERTLFVVRRQVSVLQWPEVRRTKQGGMEKPRSHSFWYGGGSLKN